MVGKTYRISKISQLRHFECVRFEPRPADKPVRHYAFRLRDAELTFMPLVSAAKLLMPLLYNNRGGKLSSTVWNQMEPEQITF